MFGNAVLRRQEPPAMMTDPIADMLTRIRNAIRTERPFVEIPCSKIKIGIAAALEDVPPRSIALVDESYLR